MSRDFAPTGFVALVALGAYPALAGEQVSGAPPAQAGFPVKPARYSLPRGWSASTLSVKFRDGSPVRLRTGALTDQGTGLLAPAAPVLAEIARAGGAWSRTHGVTEAKLAAMRVEATQNLGRPAPDLNAWFRVKFPAGFDASRFVDALNALPFVAIAQGTPLPMPLPVAPNLRNEQVYLNINTEGINAGHAWPYSGGNGRWAMVCDIEYSYNATHVDLPTITLLGPLPVDPFNDTNHGTAVMGEMFSLFDGVGTTGACYDAAAFFAAANTHDGYNVASAISWADDWLLPGNVILIEQQIAGPNYQGTGDFGLVAVEWDRETYDAIVSAIGNHTVVVEAAGNGAQNFDAPEYGRDNGGHWPFLPANDSGAIIVGAGAAPVNGSTVDRSRLGFSNYGSTVDLQGQGESVTTTGYGSRYNAEGVNVLYANNFNGTSSATPNVAAACAILESLQWDRFGYELTPAQVRVALRATGSPQQNGQFPVSQNIGPRPDVMAAATSRDLIPPPWNDECANAIEISEGGTVEGTLFGATHSRTTGCDSYGDSDDVWYYFDLPQSVGGTLTVTTCGSHDVPRTDAGPDLVVSLYNGCEGAELACNDDAQNLACGTLDNGVRRDSSANCHAVPGQRIAIRISPLGTTKPGPFKVNASFLPDNDNCQQPLDVSGGGTFDGALAGATSSATYASCGNSATNPDVFFAFTAPDGACANAYTLTVSTCGTNDRGGVDQGMDTVLALFDECYGTELDCNDDAQGACGNSDVSALRDSFISRTVRPYEQVLIRVAPYGTSEPGRFYLNVNYVPTNDRCTDPRPVSEGSITYCNIGCDTDGNPDNACLNSGDAQVGADLWFRFAPPAGRYRIDTCGSYFDTKLAVYQAGSCPPPANSAIACNDDSATCGDGSVDSAVELQAPGGVDYLIRVGGYSPQPNQPEQGFGFLNISRYCAADFDGDGFVTGIDFDLYVAAFESGDLSSDFDGDGFITGIDFDLYVVAFEAGC